MLVQRFALAGTAETVVGRFDPRLKIVLLLLFSIAVFCARDWGVLGILALMALAATAVAHLSPWRLLLLCVPLLAILTIIWFAHAFVLGGDPALMASHVLNRGEADGSELGADVPTTLIELTPWLAFSPAGSLVGSFYVARIVLVFLASFVVVLTTSSEGMTCGFSQLLSPLRRLRVPVEDVALMLSLALRFIPLALDAACQIKAAQVSRGARFDVGSPLARMQAAGRMLVPLAVALFRRSDRIAEAMSARCYGAADRRTMLSQRSLPPVQVVMFVALAAMCVVATIL